MKEFRAKSPEPPMPLMIRVPLTWVEFTLPYRSNSTHPFIAITPSRLMTPTWLLIDWGRRRILSL